MLPFRCASRKRGIAFLAGVAVGLLVCGRESLNAAPAVAHETSKGASAVNAERAVSAQGSFQLHILREGWECLRLGYDLQPAWTVLQEAYASTTAFSITQDDIEAYNWSEQVMTLTPEASDLLCPKDTRLPEFVLDLQGFVITVDGDPVYGGVFMHPASPLAIDYPVIYVERIDADSKVTLTLRPVHSVFHVYSKYEPQWNGIKDPRIRALFDKAGRLVE